MSRGRKGRYKTKLKHPVAQFLQLHLLDFIFITSPCLEQAEVEIARVSEKVEKSWLDFWKVSLLRLKIPRGVDDDSKANKTPSIICHDKLNRRVQTAFPNLYHTSSVETNTLSFTTTLDTGIEGIDSRNCKVKFRLVLYYTYYAKFYVNYTAFYD